MSLAKGVIRAVILGPPWSQAMCSLRH